jgi:hypothetical protein
MDDEPMSQIERVNYINIECQPMLLVFRLHADTHWIALVDLESGAIH